MGGFPRIGLGMIVLNGEPFIRYNLRVMYPFAYQIIIVEGAVGSVAVNATSDCDSTESTLKTLRQFKAPSVPEWMKQLRLKV